MVSDWNYREFIDNHSALGLKSDIIFSTDGRNLLDQQEVYRCHRCSRTYKYQQTLVRHLKYECGKAPQFSCMICSRHFRRNDYLDKHLFRKHKIVQNKSVKF